MTEKKDKVRLGLMCRLEKNDTFDGRASTWARIIPVLIKYKAGQLVHDYIGGYSDAAEYQHLALSTLLASDVSATEQTIGGGNVEMRDIYSAQCYEMQRMSKTITRVVGAMEKTNAKFGRPSSFGQMAARLAAAIGADIIVIEKSARAQERTGEKWHYVDVGAGVRYIDESITEWNARYAVNHKPAEAPADLGVM